MALRRADHADGGRRAVLLVVGVQDQQDVQRAGHLRVDLVGLGREPERHPQEVLDEALRVVRVEERLADRLLVGVRRDRRQLGQQPDGGQLDVVGVERVEAVLVEGRQRRDGRGEHRHRVRVAREPVEERLEVLVQQRVAADLVGEFVELGLAGQLAVDQQVADLQERRVLRELVDRVAAVAQDARVAVDVGDGGAAGRGVAVAGVERGVAGAGEQLADVERRGSLGGRLDRQLLVAAGQVEYGGVVSSHRGGSLTLGWAGFSASR